jgi:hypothetical protein
MTFTLSLLAGSAAEVDWSRPLMIGWIIIALGLSLIEIWLVAGLSSRGFPPVTKLAATMVADSRTAGEAPVVSVTMNKT